VSVTPSFESAQHSDPVTSSPATTPTAAHQTQIKRMEQEIAQLKETVNKLTLENNNLKQVRDC
jgi:hypothetical protein